jgi:flavorubredoxin
VDKYREWAAQKAAPYAVVIYETMWEATRRMAEAVAEGLQAEGIEHKLFYASVSDRNDINTEIFKARAVILGSSTHNRGVLAPLAPVLEDIRGMGFRNKIGAAFGSYGWSGEGVKVLEEHLTAAGIPVVAPGVRAKWQPSAADLQDCRELGRKVAAAVKA